MKAEVIEAAEHVKVLRFGGEGTGAQCSLPCTWSTGCPIYFELHTTSTGETTDYSAFFNDSHVATIRKRADTFLSDTYSFIEDAKWGAEAVHLRYQIPPVAALNNTVIVKESVPRTFFVACGFHGGYLGVQDYDDEGYQRVLFSIWDSDSKCVVTGPKPQRNWDSAAKRRTASFDPHMKERAEDAWKPITRARFTSTGQDTTIAGGLNRCFWLSTGGDGISPSWQATTVPLNTIMERAIVER